MSTNRLRIPCVSLILTLVLARGGVGGAADGRFYFPPPGESFKEQDRRSPGDVGLRSEVVEELKSHMKSERWALWRHGYLVHVEGDFNRNTEVKSLRKTWHALTVGAAIKQGRIPSIDQRISVQCNELAGKHANATWRHVITQTSGFDYPYEDYPGYGPGEMWTYSDKNPRHLCNALARVFGKKDYSDDYDDVVCTAYFDAIGMRGWKTNVRQDGIRFQFDLEDMGRLGLLVVTRGRWVEKELIPRSFIEKLETKRTRGAKVNYNGPDDGRVGLDRRRFPEAPYGFMTWVNTDGDYYPGADRAWAWGAGAGGSYVLWNHENGIVFAGFGVNTRPTASGIPHAIELCIAGDNPLAKGSGKSSLVHGVGTPQWVSFPGERWQSITAEEAGLNVDKFNVWVKSQQPRFGTAYGGQKPGKGGVVIARGGYILHAWGDPDFKYQSASLGKTFTRMALQLAVDDGLIKSPNGLVRDYWPGAGLLAPHKVMTRQHNAKVTFLHLQNMRGGFPVSNGFFWESRKGIPSWAKYSGDPDRDNYAHVEPGSRSRYSSGGYWRLSQALTAIWEKDLKDLLDERIMSKIGIPAERWDWLSGEFVRNNRDFYPEMPGYGGYLDRPYRIDGIVVRGGGGWVVMSVKDLARVGLLVATNGEWQGKRLISKIGGNQAVGGNRMAGWSVVKSKDGYFSFGKVATQFRDPTPDQMASWIVGPVKR